MRNYTTQMDAARRGIITPEMKAVAVKEYRTEEEIRELVAKGQAAICANRVLCAGSFIGVMGSKRNYHFTSLFNFTARTYHSFSSNRRAGCLLYVFAEIMNVFIGRGGFGNLALRHIVVYGSILTASASD